MRRNGFTLIEVMVALAILGISATALFSLFSSSMVNLTRVQDLHHYQLAGEDLMNRVLLLSSLPEGRVEGEIGRLNARWAVDVRPWLPVTLEGRPSTAVMKIDVQIGWDGRSGPRSVRLETIKPVAVAYDSQDFRGAIENALPQ